MSAAAAWASTSRERARMSRSTQSTMPSHNDATTAPAAIAEYRINWLIVWSKLMSGWLLCRGGVYHVAVCRAIGVPALQLEVGYFLSFQNDAIMIVLYSWSIAPRR